MKALPDGTLVPDLASTYSVSDDSLSYTFTLRDNLTWSDGQPITTDDIEFTILKAQDSGLKSPRRAMWEGVTIEKQSPTEIRFILRQPYALFLENTTMGILPKHIWKSIEIDEFPFSQFNVEPIGSGPFIVDSVKRNENGIPSRYELVPNDDYALGAPFIEKLIIQFYQNEKIAIVGVRVGNIFFTRATSEIDCKNNDETFYFINDTLYVHWANAKGDWSIDRSLAVMQVSDILISDSFNNLTSNYYDGAFYKPELESISGNKFSADPIKLGMLGSQEMSIVITI
jgi:ABC-type transport system substrate-binding protein